MNHFDSWCVIFGTLCLESSYYFGDYSIHNLKNDFFWKHWLGRNFSNVNTEPRAEQDELGSRVHEWRNILETSSEAT